MKTGMLIIVNACIWGLVMITCSMALKGTGAYGEIQNILAGGAGASLMLILFGTRIASQKKNSTSPDQNKSTE